MLNFTRKYFKVVFDVILWVYFISIVISATVIGTMLTNDNHAGGGGILGFFIGIIIGGLSTILLGGLISTFITMADDIRQLKLKEIPETDTTAEVPEEDTKESGKYFDITLKNQTDNVISKIFTRKQGDNEWVNRRLNNSGTSFYLKLDVSETNIYHFKLIDNKGKEYIKADVEVGEGKVIPIS